MHGNRGLWVTESIWGKPVGRDGLNAWHNTQRTRSREISGFTSIGADTCEAAGPWQTSQDTPRWFPAARICATSLWHKVHS